MRFLDIHSGMEGINEARLREEHDKDLEAQLEEPGVRFLHAWADPGAGKVFCLSEGPNAEAVKRVHASAGHPTDEVYVLEYDIE